MNAIIISDFYFRLSQDTVYLYRYISQPGIMRLQFAVRQRNDAAHLEKYRPGTAHGHHLFIGSHDEKILGIHITLPVRTVRNS